jgi:hypothetical protein
MLQAASADLSLNKYPSEMDSPVARYGSIPHHLPRLHSHESTFDATAKGPFGDIAHQIP